ncbi:MAG: response regulator [Oscillospiraceae bacterium]|nr:response regulator [Oscillospiraceae bacterium]
MGVLSSGKSSVLLVHSLSEKLLLLKATLSDFLRVYAVKSGKAATRSLKMVQGINLIMLDLEMPDMSGYEFLDFLKNSGEYKDIPVVVLTSSPQAEIAQKLKSYANVAGVIDLTSNSREIREMTAEFIGIKASADEKGE